MAHASSKKFGPGQQDQGKGSAEGGMSPATPEVTPETEILTNRDTARHTRDRGLDGAHVQNEELQDRAGNRLPESREDGLPEWERPRDDADDKDDQ